MSVSNPLLRELKGYVLHLVQDSVTEEISDQYEHLQPLCQNLENIFQQGLFYSFSVGYKGAESWHWLEKVTENHFGSTFSYNAALEEVRNSRKVLTPRGKLRHLIRTCLNRKCLHVPVEAIVRYKYPSGVYQSKDSILGDEILGEIFLSVLLQCSKIVFHLCLKNAVFLDETWQLTNYVTHEFVPCKILGLNVGFVRERGVVVGVEEGGVAAEDDKVEIGDLVDELNGHWIRATHRGRLSSYMKQAEGKPITLSILKGHNAVGELYPPIVKLLGKLQVDVTALEARLKARLSSGEPNPVTGVVTSKSERAGIPVQYLGSVSTGSKGDVNQIDRAITAVLRSRMSKIKSGEPPKDNNEKEYGQFEIQDMGIQVSLRQTGKVFLKHSYMEISSCGGRSDLPDHFAYVAGETSCNVAKSFTCYVFHCSNEEQIRLILQSIGKLPDQIVKISLRDPDSNINHAFYIHFSFGLDSNGYEGAWKSDKFTMKPNIVVLVSDDMGWGDLGANWQQHSPTITHGSSKTVTPNLDSLAKEGLRLTDFHAAASVCSPSRAALLTSRLGLRTGVVQNFNVDAVGGLPENETTVAKVLLDAGYRTAMFGKWHLGLTEGHHPIDHGFQSYLGVPYSVDMGCTNPPGVSFPDCPGCSLGNDVMDWKIYSKMSHFNEETLLPCRDDVAIPLISNRSIIHQPVKLENLSSVYGKFAENFILNSDGSGPPFFLYGAFSHVHVPLLTKNGSNLKERVFKESLSEMDDIVGQIVEALKKLNSRLLQSEFPARDTLIWFTSDNGPWEAKCELSGSWGPFSGEWQRCPTEGGGGGASKQTVWEAGHRVPSLVHWPSQIKAGRISNSLLSTLDIMPTLAAIAGARLPQNRLFDGEDISDILLKNTKNHLDYSKTILKFGERILFHPNSGASGNDGEIGAVRIGQYKAVFYSGGAPDCSGYYPPRANHSDLPLLFNISEDPAESHPLPSQLSIYKKVMFNVRKAIDHLHQSLKADNITVADFSTNPASQPCCSHESPVCRCPWD